VNAAAREENIHTINMEVIARGRVDSRRLSESVHRAIHVQPTLAVEIPEQEIIFGTISIPTPHSNGHARVVVGLRP
jgi:hypothetical protein